MEQPKGLEDSQFPSYVCRLHKSLYGLKQAPRAWYDKLKSYLLSIDIQISTSDLSLFFRYSNGSLLLILVYVDDILVTGDSSDHILQVISHLNS